MKKLLFLVSAAVATVGTFSAVAAQDAQWTFDGATITDGEWTFNATVKNVTEMTVGTPVSASCPTSVTPLDFSKPVKSSDGQTAYVITVLNCGIRNVASVRDCVGQLTLPGEGLVTIEVSCFGECKNLSGEIVFPTTLKRLKGAVFYKCTKLTCDAACIPPGLVEMGVQVFTSTGLYGDMSLPSLVTDDMRDTFLGTKITSVYLGPGVTGLWGANNQGPFQNCTELTNVVFDSGCSVYFRANSVFNGCTKLKELDLTCATAFDSGNIGHFSGCTSLKKITFGPKLTSLGKNTFNNASALEEVVFLGPPPKDFYLPYLQDQAGYDVLAKRNIKTMVYKSNYKTPNANGLTWLDYAENGEIHSVGTTFASTNVAVVTSRRPLVAPDLVITADTEVEYASGNWQVAVTVRSGEGELYVAAAASDGKVVTNLVAAAAAPTDTPFVCVFNSLEFGETYSLSLLSRVDGIWGPSAPFETIFNGALDIAKVQDADRGNGLIGKFRISLAADVVASGDLTVAYGIGDATDADEGVDFSTLSGVAVISAGKNSVDVEIIPLPSGEAEDRTVELELASGMYFIGQGSVSMTIAGGAVFGGWIFDPTAQTVSNDIWQFAATRDGDAGIDFGAVNEDASKGPVPTALSPLDLSRAVVGTDGKAYRIISLGSLFKDAAVRSFVGALTLPGEGLTTIGAHAFNSCGNATGDLEFPSTLTTIEGAAFMSDGKLNFDATKIPAGITTLGVQVFCGTGLYGDLYLPNLVGQDFRSTFQNTKITSIRLGPGVTGSNGGYDQGFVEGCTKLTNLVFEASSVRLYYKDVFKSCTSLKELDLTMVTKLENDESNPSYQDGFFQNSGIERISFGPGLEKLSANVFNWANKLKEVVFYGPLPDDLRLPYMKNPSGQCVTTVICRANRAIVNSSGLCWLDLAKDGQIRHKGTTFAADYVTPEIDLALRPLVVLEPDGLMLIIK